MMTACIALLGSTFTTTGQGVKLSYGVEVWRGGYTLAALGIIWVVSVIVGIGGICFAAYLVVSMFAVPVLVETGVPFAKSHFFIYLACLFSGVTPPVAIAAVIATKIADGNYLKTAIESGKIAAAGLLLPVMLAFIPIIMLQPVDPLSEIIKLAGFMICLFILQVAFVGYYFRDCNFMERIIAAVSALSLLIFIIVSKYLLLILGIGLFFLVTFMQWRKNEPAILAPT